MENPELEAKTYSIAASLSITQAGKDLVDVISSISANMINVGLLNRPYEDIIKVIIHSVVRDIQDEGWDLMDVDGVSWFIGIYVKAYIQATKSTESLYTKIFSEIFVCYYRQRI